MTKIKLCGLTRTEDIIAANELRPDFVGFVFAKGSKRYIPPERAGWLRAELDSAIPAIGVFVNEEPRIIASLLESGIIDAAQLHGSENEEYITELRMMTDKPLIKAFRIRSGDDLKTAHECSADGILLDAGAGEGKAFDWDLLSGFERPYILAGGLDPENVAGAVDRLSPCAVDVSSGIETNGVKDRRKMKAFIDAVRKEGITK